MKDNRKLILLDTDIGDDIDDALALLMLLKSETVRLVGVTTVFANTPLRARLAKKIISLAGKKDIPVLAGCGDALAYATDKNRSFVQYTEDLQEDCYAPDNKTQDNGAEAVDYILDCAEKYGEKLTLLAIGPYTNIAAAYKKDPEKMKKIGKVILMGGCFYEQFIEYNVAMDPEAADVLMRSGLDPVFIGADVTWKAQLSDRQTAEVLAIYNGGLTGYCAELIRLWKNGCWFNPVLHDPLAAYYVIDNTVCDTERVWVETELKGEFSRGLTLNMDHCFKYLEQLTPNKKRVLCAKTVDVEKFIKYFLANTFEIYE